MKGSLGSLQTAVAQLKTAVVALELRPPLGDAAASSADCLQVQGRCLGRGQGQQVAGTPQMTMPCA